MDLFEIRSQRIIVSNFAEQHLAVPVNDRQQVVEIVRHASSESADAFHFLGLEVLFLDGPVLSYVKPDAGYAQDLAHGVIQRRVVPLEHLLTAISGNYRCLVKRLYPSESRSLVEQIPYLCLAGPAE